MGGLFYDNFAYFATLTDDVETATYGVGHAYALQVEVFGGSVQVSFDAFNTRCAFVCHFYCVDT